MKGSPIEGFTLENWDVLELNFNRSWQNEEKLIFEMDDMISALEDETLPKVDRRGKYLHFYFDYEDVRSQRVAIINERWSSLNSLGL